MRTNLEKALAGTLLLGLVGCHSATVPQTRAPRPHVVAQATMAPMNGSTISGKLLFTQNDSSTSVEVTVSGLSGGGHALTVHQGGSCGTSGSQAGLAIADLTEVHSSGESQSHLTFDDPSLYLSGGPSIIGRTVVLHTDENRASAALACGYIEKIAP